MEIAILVFFLAIFGGVLFLAVLIWVVSRLIRNRRPTNRNFADSRANYGRDYISSDDDNNSTDSADSADVIYNDNSAFGDQSGQSAGPAETVSDSRHLSEHIHSHTSHHEHSAPPSESIYSESSSSGYDSGASYDSGSSSSYDSSSSSDSGSSSSSDSGSSSSSD